MQERRKHFEKVKRDMFGPSSSEEDDIGGSESDSDTDRRKSTMEEESRFKESKQINEPRVSQKLELCQIYFATKKAKDNWIQDSLSFEEQSLIISEKMYHLKEIHKIKIIQGAAIADCNRIKLSTIDQS